MKKGIIISIIIAAVIAAFFVFRKKKNDTIENEEVKTDLLPYILSTGTKTEHISRVIIQAPFTGIIKLNDKNSYLNVRETPSISGKQISKLFDGQQIDIIENVGEWYGIALTPFNKTVYVHKDFVIPSDSSLQNEGMNYYDFK